MEDSQQNDLLWLKSRLTEIDIRCDCWAFGMVRYGSPHSHSTSPRSAHMYRNMAEDLCAENIFKAFMTSPPNM